MLILPVPINKAICATLHFLWDYTSSGCPVVGTHLPQQARTYLSAQKALVRSRVSPQTHPSGKTGRAGGMSGSHPHSQHVAFPARLGLLPTLAGFINWSPLQEPNLSLPKAVQKPQVTTALPVASYLISVYQLEHGSESENTSGSTGALFLAL